MGQRKKNNNNSTVFLTFPIYIRKRSVIHKVGRAAITVQHFKNLMYLIVREYYKNTKDLKPFTSVNFIEKFVKGKETLPFENENIRNWKSQLIEIWKDKLGSDFVKSLANIIVREIKSVIKLWKNGYYTELPKPRKLDNVHTVSFITNKNMLSDKRFLKRNPDNSVAIRLGKEFGAIKVKLPKSFNYQLKELKIKWVRDTEVVVYISYEIPKTEFKNLNLEKWLSIDIGINRIVSVISNVEDLRSFLIDGNGIKAFNQWSHKLAAHLKSQNKFRVHRHLWKYWNKRIKAYLHSVANKIIITALKYKIGTIIIPKGLEQEYQKESNKSSKFNQEFRSIPLGKLLNLIKQKAEIFGIKVIEESETFTSKLSSISDNIEVISGKSKSELTKDDYKKLTISGKRIKRGLYIDHKINKVFHADLNGALNLAIKALGRRIRDEFLKLRNWLDKLSRPIKVVPEFPINNYLMLIGNKG